MHTNLRENATLSPRFDLSARTGRTRKNGHLNKAIVRFLAYPSPSQRSLRQRDLPAPRRCTALGDPKPIARLKPFGELIDPHIDDMCDVGKSPAVRERRDHHRAPRHSPIDAIPRLLPLLPCFQVQSAHLPHSAYLVAIPRLQSMILSMSACI